MPVDPSKLFNVATVAKRLSRVQRRAVLRGGISDENASTRFVLCHREHLFYFEPSVHTTCGSLRLTQFGELVAEHLALGVNP